MKVQARQVEGMTFVAMGDSKHWIAMDTLETVGGNEAAARPLELVLMGLAGCTGMDVVSILRKMHVAFDRFEIHVDADQVDTHPKVFKLIRIEYRIFGQHIDENKVKKAVQLSSEKYCPVVAMFRQSTEIQNLFQIFPLDIH